MLLLNKVAILVLLFSVAFACRHDVFRVTIVHPRTLIRREDMPRQVHSMYTYFYILIWFDHYILFTFLKAFDPPLGKLNYVVWQLQSAVTIWEKLDRLPNLILIHFH